MSVVLTGLDGSNPIGFMAALGTQLALMAQGRPVRLRWVDQGVWRPELEGIDSLEQVVALVEADRQTWLEEPALAFSYRKRSKKKGEVTYTEERDLKPTLESFAAFMRAMRERGGRSERLVLCFASDVVSDGSGMTKPTALHFLAGQQRFLRVVGTIRDEVRAGDLREAVAGPWRYRSSMPTLGWDATVERKYAIRALNPSDKSTGLQKRVNPGVEWLAFVGMQGFPVVPVSLGRLLTTATSGRWKRGQLTWCLWADALDAATVCCVMQQAPRIVKMSAERRRAWGIARVLRSDIHRSEQGGYGTITAPEVV